MAYWWCLEHEAVEGDGQCRGAVRLGPYPTTVAAERAMTTVAERNEAWEAADAEDEDAD